MHLVYSSQDLAEAEHVASLLSRAGLQVHLSNRRTAESLGGQLARYAISVGVWVTPSHAARAQEVLLAAGLVRKAGAVSPRKLPGWVVVIVVCVIVAVVMLAGGGL